MKILELKDRFASLKNLEIETSHNSKTNRKYNSIKRRKCKNFQIQGDLVRS